VKLALLVALVVGVLALLACGKPSPPRPKFPRSATLVEDNNPRGLTVSGNELFYVTGGHLGAENAVKRLDLTTGERTVLAKGHPGVDPKEPRKPVAVLGFVTSDALAVDATHVYWPDSGAGALYRVPRAGGEKELVGRGLDFPGIPALDGRWAWVQSRGTRSRGELARVPKEGGPREVLLIAPGSSGTLLDETHVYFRSPQGIRRLPREGGPEEVVLPGEKCNADHLVLDGETLWFALYTGESDRRLHRLPKAGGELVSYPHRVSSGIVADADSVCFFQRTGSLSGFRLVRMSKTTGELAVLDEGPYITGELALAPGGVLLFAEGGRVLRFPAP
jgi:hypothetical protein